MPDRDEMLRLAERVEAASGPCRGLDAAIHEWRCDGFDMMPDATGDQVAALLPDDVDAEAFMRECGGFAVVKVPEYTASLDAAMSLVPVGHDIQIVQGHGERAAAIVVRSDRVATDERYAATPALALTAAALRAHAAMGE